MPKKIGSEARLSIAHFMYVSMFQIVDRNVVLHFSDDCVSQFFTSTFDMEQHNVTHVSDPVPNRVRYLIVFGSCTRP